MGAKILIVEDEAITAMDIENKLEDFGFNVVGIASRGEEAIKKAEDLRPDLILMDITLKGDMDGIEAADKIKSLFGIPVIYMSAFADEDTFKRIKFTNPYGFVNKPVSPELLLVSLEAAVYKHKLDKQLAESENKFRSLYSSMAEGIAIYEASYNSDNNIVDFIISDVNPAYESILGIKRSEVIGQKVTIVHNSDKLPYIDNFIKVAESGKPEKFESYIEPIDKYFDITVTSPEKGKFATFFKDITERKKAENEKEITVGFLSLVNESKETNDLIHKATTFFQQYSGCEAVGIRVKEGIDYPYYEAHGFPEEFILLENELCAHDKDGNVVLGNDGNPIIECMCGNVICGRFDDSKPFFTAKGSFWTNSTTELVASTSEEDRQARTRNQCNGEGYESVALIPLHVGKQRLGLLQLNDHEKGIFSPEIIDLWERLADYLAVALSNFLTGEALRKAHNTLELKVQERTEELDALIEELKRSNEELEQFAYASSHDLQEPLRNIASFTQLLEKRYKGKFDSDADEFIEYIIDASIRMKQQIDDLLEYSCVTTAGKEFEQVNTDFVLNQAINNLKNSIDENNAKITHKPLPKVLADSDQLRRVFQNIVGNAIKYRKHDEHPKIHISAYKESNEYVFSVSDKGIGIDKQYLDRIFRIFQRLHTLDEYQGTGVGLAVVKKVIERHGGRTWVESELDKGSTFYFTIPIKSEKEK